MKKLTLLYDFNVVRLTMEYNYFVCFFFGLFWLSPFVVSKKKKYKNRRFLISDVKEAKDAR